MAGAAIAERRWRAMGTDCHAMVVVDRGWAPEPLLDRVVATVAALEARWSRFDPASELSLVNAAAGTPVAVSDETLLAVDVALDGRSRTAGRFDPTVLAGVRSAGYDRDFALVAARGAAGAVLPSPAVPGGAGVALDLDAGTVTVAAGAGLDLGGVGKGLAADLAAGAALAAGAQGACINLGGDLRVAGEAHDGGGWCVVVDDPIHAGASLAELHLTAGGVATSSTRRRRWWRAGGGLPAHHLVDPATGAPADTDVAAVTVVAGTAADAEILATAAAVAGAEAALALLAGEAVGALLVRVDGTTLHTPELEPFLR